MNIGWAVKEMHNGNRVRRAGWNGKGMYLFLVPGLDLCRVGRQADGQGLPGAGRY
jgi:hypothetical protein